MCSEHTVRTLSFRPLHARGMDNDAAPAGINFFAFRQALGTDPRVELRLSGKVVPPLPQASTLSLHTFRRMVDDEMLRADGGAAR